MGQQQKLIVIAVARCERRVAAPRETHALLGRRPAAAGAGAA